MKSINFGIALIAIIIIGSFNYSCEKSPNEDLVGKWTLLSVEDINIGSPTSYPDSIESKISIILTDSSVVSLDGYCNSGSGHYLVDGGKISFFNLHMTEMGCLMVGWEEYFLRLAEANSFVLDQDQLKIFTDGDIRVLNFSKEE